MFGKGGEDLGQYGKNGILFGVLGVGKETRPELGPGDEVFISKGGWFFKGHHFLSPVCKVFDPKLNHLWPVCLLVMGTILPHSTASNQSLRPTF